MESKSTLAPRNLTVSVEQGSLFLTEDNVVISVFEHSAPDVLHPIQARLAQRETILRRSGDGSMLTQAIIDAIIDLAMPVASAFDDAIANTELNVLLDPNIQQPKRLYILTSEITLLKNLIQPVAGLVNALRDHRAEPVATPGLTGRPPKLLSSSSVTISRLSMTYLADVNDHVLTLAANLDTMRNSAENLTSLIFNMMGAYQNESMKQLTIVTIFFLVSGASQEVTKCCIANSSAASYLSRWIFRPGSAILPLSEDIADVVQNFDRFWAVHQNSDAFFWYVATPTMVVTCLFLMRGMIGRQIERTLAKYSWKKNAHMRAKAAVLEAQRRQNQQSKHFGGLDGYAIGNGNGINKPGQETLDKARRMV